MRSFTVSYSERPQQKAIVGQTKEAVVLSRGRSKAGDEVRRHQVDLESALSERVDILLSHAMAFDSGSPHFAKAIALDLRILLLDSLLAKLRMLGSMGFYDSAVSFDPENLFPHHGLVLVGNGGILPAFDDGAPAPRSFIRWRHWAEAVVMSSAADAQFSRKRLVQDVANLEGAHEDFDLPADYNALTRGAGLGYQVTARGLEFAFRPDGVPVEPAQGDGGLPSPVPSAIRQLAHEVLVSLAHSNPSCFAQPQIADSLLQHRPAPLGIRSIRMRRTTGPESSESLYVVYNHPLDPA